MSVSGARRGVRGRLTTGFAVLISPPRPAGRKHKSRCSRIELRAIRPRPSADPVLEARGTTISAKIAMCRRLQRGAGLIPSDRGGWFPLLHSVEDQVAFGRPEFRLPERNPSRSTDTKRYPSALSPATIG